MVAAIYKAGEETVEGHLPCQHDLGLLSFQNCGKFLLFNPPSVCIFFIATQAGLDIGLKLIWGMERKTGRNASIKEERLGDVISRSIF